MDKKVLREEMKNLRKGMGADEVLSKSKIVQDKLLKLGEFKNADAVAFYVSKKSENEVDTEYAIRKSLAMSKKVLVPISDKDTRTITFSELKDFDNDLALGQFGIRESKNDKCVDTTAIKLVVVPGLSFDVRGNRIGYGFGYYDNFLCLLRPDVPKIGLAYDFQVVDEIFPGKNDMPVDKIVTEKRVIDCS